MLTGEESLGPPSDADAPSEREREELADVLRQRTRSEDEARDVLDVLAEALEVARLPVDDLRLHVNFGAATGWAVNIVIGKRAVAWLDGRRCFFGFLLDDQELAERKAAALRPEGDSTMFRRPDAPGLNLHVRHLRSALPEVRASWHRAISAEVGRGFANPYRARHHRPSLYAMLSDNATRSEVARQAHRTRYWWFGVTFRNEGQVRINQIAPFLKGIEDQFKWPIGSSKPKALMRPRDRALLWTGHARGNGNNWGFLGTATILDSNEEHALLGAAKPFPKPLTPYPEGLPADTYEVQFLARTFGQDFPALADVMRAVFGAPRRPPVTVAEVSGDAFWAVVNWATVPDSAAAASTCDDEENVAVNAAIVRLAKALTGAVEAEPPRRADGSARWWNVVAEGRHTDNHRFLWKLRPALRDAALALGIGSVDRGTFADELAPNDKVLLEGAVKHVPINVYERNPVARRRCIEHYGAICSVCDFNFAAVYGPIAEGFIHVHHLRLISECGGEDYEVDPIAELRPVCPNCHAVLHRRDPPFEINELKGILSAYRDRRSST